MKYFTTIYYFLILVIFYIECSHLHHSRFKRGSSTIKKETNISKPILGFNALDETKTQELYSESSSTSLPILSDAISGERIQERYNGTIIYGNNEKPHNVNMVANYSSNIKSKSESRNVHNSNNNEKIHQNGKGKHEQINLEKNHFEFLTIIKDSKHDKSIHHDKIKRSLETLFKNDDEADDKTSSYAKQHKYRKHHKNQKQKESNDSSTSESLDFKAHHDKQLNNEYDPAAFAIGGLSANEPISLEELLRSYLFHHKKDNLLEFQKGNMKKSFNTDLNTIPFYSNTMPQLYQGVIPPPTFDLNQNNNLLNSVGGMGNAGYEEISSFSYPYIQPSFEYQFRPTQQYDPLYTNRIVQHSRSPIQSTFGIANMYEKFNNKRSISGGGFDELKSDDYTSADLIDSNAFPLTSMFQSSPIVVEKKATAIIASDPLEKEICPMHTIKRTYLRNSGNGNGVDSFEVCACHLMKKGQTSEEDVLTKNN